MGGILLFAAIITWATTLMMSPHGSSVAEGTEHVREVVVIFVRNSAFGTLVLCALSGWLLFPSRRPKAPRRDYVVMALIGLLVLTSLYQLFWLYRIAG